MFNIRRWIRWILFYSCLSSLCTFWYLTAIDSNVELKSVQEHRLAVIVPFRDRAKELEIFLRHMHQFLKSQSIEHVFMIINQIDKHRFNRAALINIGFIESCSFVDYIVMHDIDLLPLNQRELSYRYPEHGPVHLASPEYHPMYHYATYVGGILMISCRDFERINGISPLYWGWGREDDNFYVRMRRVGMKLSRPTKLSTNTTNTFDHIHDKGVHKRDYARYGQQKEEGNKVRPEMGWNTTKYDLIDKNLRISNQGIEYWMLDVNIFCDYSLTPWCDHPTNETRK